VPLEPFTAAPYGATIRGVRGGTGPPALLLHGTAGSWRNFRDWLPALLPRAALLIPDLPGCGDSPVPPVRPGLRTWARLLHALTIELRAPPRILVGLGLGASVALAYLDVAPPAARAALTHVVLHTPPYCPAAIRPAFRWGVPLVGAAPVFAVVQRLLRHPAVLDWYLDRTIGGPGVPSRRG
jgi:pimeloyl-ACP methyl ester carboxylesterase